MIYVATLAAIVILPSFKLAKIIKIKPKVAKFFKLFQIKKYESEQSDGTKF